MGVPNAGDLCQEMNKIMYQRLMVIKMKHTGCVVTLFFLLLVFRIPPQVKTIKSLFSSAHISLVFSDAITCAFTFINACALRRPVRGGGGPNMLTYLVWPDQILTRTKYFVTVLLRPGGGTPKAWRGYS